MFQGFQVSISLLLNIWDLWGTVFASAEKTCSAANQPSCGQLVPVATGKVLQRCFWTATAAKRATSALQSLWRYYGGKTTSKSNIDMALTQYTFPSSYSFLNILKLNNAFRLSARLPRKHFPNIQIWQPAGCPNDKLCVTQKYTFNRSEQDSALLPFFGDELKSHQKQSMPANICQHRWVNGTEYSEEIRVDWPGNANSWSWDFSFPQHSHPSTRASIIALACQWILKTHESTAKQKPASSMWPAIRLIEFLQLGILHIRVLMYRNSVIHWFKLDQAKPLRCTQNAHHMFTVWNSGVALEGRIDHLQCWLDAAISSILQQALWRTWGSPKQYVNMLKHPIRWRVFDL